MAITYEALANTTLTGTATNVTFSSISASYTDLILVVNGSISSSIENILINFNSDAGSNYSSTALTGDGSSATSSRNSNQTKFYGGVIGTGICTSIFYFNNYANATTNKTILHRMSNAGGYSQAIVGLWRSTAAISTIKVSLDVSTFTSGTSFALYGIKAA